jgi:hypothetical protein
LPREAHNAPLHLFSASPELVGFGRAAYRQRSEHTSRLLRLLLERVRGEGLVMPFTMEDFERWYFKEHFGQLTPAERVEIVRSLPPEEWPQVLQSLSPEERRQALQSLSPEERRQVLQSLPPEERLAGLSVDQIRQYLDRLTAGPPEPRKSRRKKERGAGEGG